MTWQHQVLALLPFTGALYRSIRVVVVGRASLHLTFLADADGTATTGTKADLKAERMNNERRREIKGYASLPLVRVANLTVFVGAAPSPLWPVLVAAELSVSWRDCTLSLQCWMAEEMAAASQETAAHEEETSSLSSASSCKVGGGLFPISSARAVLEDYFELLSAVADAALRSR